MNLDRVNLPFVLLGKPKTVRLWLMQIFCVCFFLPSGLGSFSQMPQAQDTCSHFLDSAVVMNIFQRLPILAHQRSDGGTARLCTGWFCVST